MQVYKYSKINLFLYSFFDHAVEEDLKDVTPEEESVEFLSATDNPHHQASTQRITTRFLTKYERARVLGTRAQQIAMCCPIMVELDGETDPLQIAVKELR